MELKTYVPDPLNEQASILVDAQTDIKTAIKKGVLGGASFVVISAEVRKIISRTIARIRSPPLQKDARVSLMKFANKAYSDFQATLNLNGTLLAAVVLLSERITERKANGLQGKYFVPKTPREIDAVEQVAERTEIRLRAYDRGLPLQEFQKTYIDRVSRALSGLAEEKALDPNDVTGRNSLRNLAEMQVRYERHLQEIADLKNSGTRLVVCSVHADCSDRCAPWQGRVYSLDGTSGTTEDGRKFIPLETATDIYYTTKAGRTYKNGLLGFNCYDDKTEVYTNEGWKLFKDLNGNELFYTLNPSTKESAWQRAVNFFRKKHIGKMIHLKSATTDLCVTPDHNLLYFTQKDKALRFKPAAEFSTATFLTCGQDWNARDIESVTIGGKEVDGDLFCKFMAYYLADGSLHNLHAIKIAQQNNDEMFNELSNLPFKVWHDKEKIVIYGKELAQELKRFGVCTQKYIPEIIKQMSRRQLRLFLEAYIKTDGYASKAKSINGYVRNPHLSVFTTSKRMAADLGEVAMKAGFRPRFDIQQCAGREIKFRNGKYTINNNLIVIHLNYFVNVTHLKKSVEDYNGFVYCVEVPNHTLLVRRNGRVIWCGNCRHKLLPYKANMVIPFVSETERKKEDAITKRQRALERAVIGYREEALMYKGNNAEKYREARRNAVEVYDEYKRFSKKNGRAYYPDRVKIL